MQGGALLRRLRAVHLLRLGEPRRRGVLWAPQVVQHGIVQGGLLHCLSRVHMMVHAGPKRCFHTRRVCPCSRQQRSSRWHCLLLHSCPINGLTPKHVADAKGERGRV